MEERKRSFRWYWLLGTEVILAVAEGGIVSVFLLLPDGRYLWSVLTLCLLLAMTVAQECQRRLYQRLGPSRIRPTKAFTLSFWVLMIVEAVGGESY